MKTSRVLLQRSVSNDFMLNCFSSLLASCVAWLKTLTLAFSWTLFKRDFFKLCMSITSIETYLLLRCNLTSIYPSILISVIVESCYKVTVIAKSAANWTLNYRQYGFRTNEFSYSCSMNAKNICSDLDLTFMKIIYISETLAQAFCFGPMHWWIFSINRQ